MRLVPVSASRDHNPPALAGPKFGAVLVDRYTLQMLITKLDLNHITLAEAREFVARNYGLNSVARTKRQFVRECSQSTVSPTAPQLF